MILKRGLLGILVLISILVLVAGCSPPAPSATTTAKPAPAATSAAPAPTTKAATTAAPAPSTSAAPKPSVTTAAPAPAPTSKAAAETPAQFYGKNVLTIYTGGAGGTIDFLSRLVATYWSQKVEGGLAKVVNNHGGSITTAATYVQKDVKPDGLSLVVAGEFESRVLLGDPSAKYDPTAFTYLAAVGQAPCSFVLSAKSPYKSINDLKGVSGFVIGTIGLISQDSAAAVLLTSVLGMKDARLTTGYAGSAEIGLALARGEIGGAFPGASALDFIANKFSSPALAIADFRTKWFPDSVPLVSELVPKLTPEQQANLDVVLALTTINKIMTSPGVPQDRVDFLRDIVMNKILTDKNFLTQAALKWPIWTTPISGADYQERCKKIMSVKKETVDVVSAAAKKMAGM